MLKTRETGPSWARDQNVGLRLGPGLKGLVSLNITADNNHYYYYTRLTVSFPGQPW